jgi:Ser/Thr protein kinase RdoA (MazF antagonist)
MTMASFVSQDLASLIALIKPTLRENYGYSPSVVVAPLAVAENVNLLVDDPDHGTRAVLRLCRPDYHSRAEVASEVAWVDSIYQQTAVKVPAVIKAIGGDAITTFTAPQGISMMGVLFEFVHGHTLGLGDINPSLYAQLGATTAQLHAHSEVWRPPQSFSRRAWFLDDLISENARFGYWAAHPDLSPSQRTTLQAAADRARSRIGALSGQSAEIGLVHSDLHVANVMRAGEQLWVIDFDDCGPSWYMQDASVALACLDPAVSATDVTQSWIDGYRSVRPLDNDSVAVIADFVMTRHLYTLGWCATHPHADLPAMYSDVAPSIAVAAELYLAGA